MSILPSAMVHAAIIGFAHILAKWVISLYVIDIIDIGF
jgi:hypothetical protein